MTVAEALAPAPTRAFVPAVVVSHGHDPAAFRIVRWRLTDGEAGKPEAIGAYPKVTIYCIGMFGKGSVQIEVSPDPQGSCWATASDMLGIRLTGIRSPRADVIVERGALIRPVSSPGLESADVWAVLTK